MNIKKRTWEILDSSNPHDRVSKNFDVAIIVLIVLNVTMVILDSVPSINAKYGSYLYIFEAFSVAIFTIEYLARIWSANYDSNYQHPLFGRIRFALKPSSLIDLLAIIPFYLPFFGVDLRILRAFRLMRLLRILKLARYSSAFTLITNVIKEKREELALTSIMLFLMLIVSAALMYIAENEAQPENFSSIPAAIWWSVVTLTTVGYGDVYPITDMGRLFAGTIAIIGIGIVALPAGIISAGFVEAIQNKNHDEKTSVCPHCGKDIHP